MVNVKYINEERLGRWRVRMNRTHSTPVLMVTVGHDHNQGQMHVLTTEDMTNENLILFLTAALAQLQQKTNNNDGTATSE